ncbi:MAG: hypothetical protein KDA42_11585, partial [Planctomycetales bacterium]|nr:hypothetical protein [Planctomycetales bacterium]
AKRLRLSTAKVAAHFQATQPRAVKVNRFQSTQSASAKYSPNLHPSPLRGELQRNYRKLRAAADSVGEDFFDSALSAT